MRGARRAQFPVPFEEPEQVARRCIPGAGAVELRRVSAGLVNETYRVLREGRSYSLRVAVSRGVELGVDREWEATILTAAATAGLAPDVEYCDPGAGVLVTRWITGRSWSVAETREPRNIARVAQMARRVHGLVMPPRARTVGPVAWIDFYQRTLGRCNSLPSPRLAALGPALTEWARAFAQAPPAATVVCHSDLHTMNLLDIAGSLVLLDWEHAHGSEPLWDLAGWAANNDFDAEASTRLVTSYMAFEPSPPSQHARFAQLRWAYDYVCLLWSEIYLHLCSAATAQAGTVAARANQLAARLTQLP